MSLFDLLQSSSCHRWHHPPLIFTCATWKHTTRLPVFTFHLHHCVCYLTLMFHKFPCSGAAIRLGRTQISKRISFPRGLLSGVGSLPLLVKKKKRKSTEKGSVLRPSAGNTRRLVNTFHVTTMATAARSRSGVTRAPACRHFGPINSSELNRSRRRFNSSVVETKRQ